MTEAGCNVSVLASVVMEAARSVGKRNVPYANIESSPVWDIYCIVGEPYADMRERAITSDEAG